MFDSVWQHLLYTVWLYGMGILLGYILWAPTTPFKRGLMDGFMLGPLVRFIQRRFK
jgi:predicted PurR-regulated permease PerM